MMNKQIKDAIMDMLKARIDRENYGMLSNYRISPSSPLILKNNGIVIDGNFVYQNGKPIFKIIDRYAAKKTNGMYKKLKPELKEV